MLKRERKLNRWQGWDYSREGFYFVTIDCKNMGRWFGEIINKKINLNDYGVIADSCWRKIPKVYKGVRLDKYVIMPNHVHGIIRIIKVGTAQCAVRTNGFLSKIIKSYKNAVTKEIRGGEKLKYFEWHRSFYDRIIRDERELENVRKYIKNNPKNWNK